MLANLDLGDWLNIAILLLLIVVLLRARHVSGPMPPESRAFFFKFVENNTGIGWAFIIILVFLGAMFHGSHDHDNAVVETMKNVLLVAVGWMGNMLTGRTGKAVDHPELVPGTEGTRDTTTVTHEKAIVVPPEPVPAEPEKPQ